MFRLLGQPMPEVTRGIDNQDRGDPLRAVLRAAQESRAAEAALRQAVSYAHAAGLSPRQAAEVTSVRAHHDLSLDQEAASPAKAPAEDAGELR